MALNAGTLATTEAALRASGDSGGAATTDESEQAAAERLAARFFEAVPEEVRRGLTGPQREALSEAAKSLSWSRHATDIRLSIPFFAKRYYLVLLGGEERRSRDRLVRDRVKHPFGTLTNFLFLSLLGVCCTFVGGFFFTLILIWYLSL